MPGDPSNELDGSEGQKSPIDAFSLQSFAYLEPFNREARFAFDHAVDAIKLNPALFAYASRNMTIEPVRHESVSATSVFTDSDTAEIAIGPETQPIRYQGGHHFKLSNPPRYSKKGWDLGDRRSLGAR